MLERWTLSDIMAGLAGAAAVAYVLHEIKKRQNELRDLINVLDADDIALTQELEQMVADGHLTPFPTPRSV